MSIRHPASPAAMIGSYWSNRHLLADLVRRDFLGRYKGSVLGVLWSLFYPVLMLTIFTFVFTVAFKARWPQQEESKVAFAVVLFSGMIVHNFFAECLNRAPTLITGHPNYVKKVVFPLEVLPMMVMLSALLHLVVSFFVLLAFCGIAGIDVHAGVLLTPIVLLPLVLTTLGLALLFASLGVYLRDLSQVMGVLTTVALFMAPVFYPIDAIPEAYRAALFFNPITLPVIQLRELMLWDTGIGWNAWGTSLLVGAIVSSGGYWWFQKSRRGFADVV